jgi:uncharacterized membrane protein YkoI
MKRRSLLVLLAGLVVIAVAGGAVAAIASDDGSTPAVESVDDESAEDAAEGPDVPITGTALERASQAALDWLGEGRVTDTEVGDEESYYEVEVRLDDGREVDVQLDGTFNVVGTD